jgi:hypothetical protein
MNDIFISYARSDHAIAHRFADALEKLGWSVFWDREIPVGQSFDQVIERELASARCVLVLWSKDSVQSRWVKAEASAAVERGRLVPVLIERVAIPLEFRLIQSAELWDWNADTEAPEFARVVQAVAQMLARPERGGAERSGAVPSGAPGGEEAEGTGLAAWLRAPRVLAGAAAAVAVIVALFSLGSPAPPPADGAGATGPESGADSPAARPDVAATAPGSTAPPGVSSSPASAAALPPPAAPAGGFAVSIGDRIAEGAPGPGAGSIQRPHEQDVYVFNARPGQSAYFRMAGHSNGMASIRWRLVDANGAEVFDTCLACSEPGVQRLATGGTYTLTVGSDADPATGTYQLRLFDVPAPDVFPVRIGDALDENRPGPGAGAIETPGAEDVYTFAATARQRVYFRMLARSPGMDYIAWRLVDPNDRVVFDACLGCTEPGVQALLAGGTYTLTVGSRSDPSTGTYRARLYDVPPPDRFMIEAGARVGPGQPGPGAGVIESPGAQDTYVFRASAGQRLFFRLLTHDAGTDYLRWRLEDDNGMEIFETCLGCSEPGLRTLTRGGEYVLTVGHPTDPSTGEYSFEIGAP